MKQYKSILLVLFLILGCQREIEHNDNTKKNAIPMSFYAGIEMPTDSSLTKTVLDGYPTDAFRNVLWEYQDKVYVTNGLQSSKFINTSQGTSEVALLEGELEEGTYYFAAYPYKMVTSSSTSSITVNLPSEQTYCKDGIESETFPMVAQCENGIFNFKNLCGIFVLQLVGDKTISSITFCGKDSDENDMIVAGKGMIAMDYSDVPILNLDDSATTSVKLICPEGVALNRTTPTMFHIVLPEGNYNSFEIRISATDRSTMEISSDKPMTIKRSMRTTAAELTYSGVVDASDLNLSGETANCYIVSEAGSYKFKTVKGNSSESVGDVAEVEVLWESFGTEVRPNVGDLIDDVSYSNGRIYFSTPDSFREGNAVIAAKDEDGVILWSWHIWLTDKPEEQVYYNNAGTMMDRNLGATSATPGDIESHGLLYQWGRKDPFLGTYTRSASIAPIVESTGNWQQDVSSTSSTGTIEYSIKNPMSFIMCNNGYDWQYENDPSRWGLNKTQYDPCPSGWEVPVGGNNGIWVSSRGSGDKFTTGPINSLGTDFSGEFGSSAPIWYPAAGCRDAYGSMVDSEGWEYSGNWGCYWSSSYIDHRNFSMAYTLFFDGNANPVSQSMPAEAQSIRCVQVGSFSIETASHIDLSSNGTANCYIVSQSGKYKFNASVKGNSTESIGEAVSAEVLWESFGTDVTPSVGDILKNATYKDGYIEFETPSTLTEGNAVIAAKDASGTILWSWHIWVTDQLEEQVYYYNAGIMMDRNLGATSATPGDVGALGLLYQWGRKDPFLGSSSISSSVEAKSTITWPSAVGTASSRGVDYVTSNPTTFVYAWSSPYDWHYSYRDDALWTTSDKTKSIYDPCPAGWRVPDGGDNGIWATAYGSSSNQTGAYDSTNKGTDFSRKYGSATTIWYPTSGFREGRDMGDTYCGGELDGVGEYGRYWSASLNSDYPYKLFCDPNYVSSMNFSYRAGGSSIRCAKD